MKKNVIVCLACALLLLSSTIALAGANQLNRKLCNNTLQVLKDPCMGFCWAHPDINDNPGMIIRCQTAVLDAIKSFEGDICTPAAECSVSGKYVRFANVTPPFNDAEYYGWMCVANNLKDRYCDKRR